ncbi:MAG: UTP--glucose-1-phosphate uridylyltransferase [Deltaproteobacteria bacterium]|nr:UTP--glucose-1-phosphate uridylyltransferase [Deltaproteobacteria bacterium]
MSVEDLNRAGAELGLSDKTIEYLAAMPNQLEPDVRRLFELARTLKREKGMRLSDADFVYFVGLLEQVRNPRIGGETMRIESDFLPSALLQESQRREMGVVTYGELARNRDYREQAKSVIALFNPMDGGIGSSLERRKFVTQKWFELDLPGEPMLGAKSMDEYFEVFLQDRRYLVSVAEARLLALSALADNRVYSRILYQPLLSHATTRSMEILLDRACLEDRSAGVDAPRSYREWIEQKPGIDLVDRLIQGILPTIEKQSDRLSIDRLAPGGHAQWGVKGFVDAINDRLPLELPADEKSLISTIYNGDGINNEPDEIMLGWMHANRVPIAMVTTTKTGLDMKGGQIGIVRAGDKFYPAILEEAQAKKNNQLDLFHEIGITKGEIGAQYFNTNTVIINWSVVVPFLKDLVEAIGENELNRIISPDLIANEKRQNGKEYIQLEGAIGSVMLNFNRYLSLTKNRAVLALKQKHDIGQMVRVINVEKRYRTKFFTPVKNAFDLWLQFYSDWFSLDTRSWRICPVKPDGTLPMVSLDHEYYKDVSNVLDSFSGVSIEGLRSLAITGKVGFAGVKRIAGTVSVDNEMQSTATLADLLPEKLVNEGIEDARVRIDRAGKVTLISEAKDTGRRGGRDSAE